jgi:hypothetical protein
VVIVIDSKLKVDTMHMYIYELNYDYFMSLHYVGCIYIPVNEGCHCRDRLLVRFTTTCAISDYQ